MIFSKEEAMNRRFPYLSCLAKEGSRRWHDDDAGCAGAPVVHLCTAGIWLQIQRGGKDVMTVSRRLALAGFLTFTMLLLLYPPEVRSQGLVVDCASGGTIRGALGSLKPGDTLTVRG